VVNQKDIQKAVDILRQGGLVAMPTETVYGLGGDASNPAALRKIFAAKERPIDHPLIVHLADMTDVGHWALEVPDSAIRLAEAFWPGPLTLILKKASHVSDMVTGNQDTVGLRVPSHPVARALLKAFGGGLAAPSANRFGRISPTTAQAVEEELGRAVDLILDGGQCDVGLESTIVDVTGELPVVLRPGRITSLAIEAVLHQQVSVAKQNSPRVSGSLESHYAPRTATALVSASELSAYISHLDSANLPCAVLSYASCAILREGVEWVEMSCDSKQYAHDLYRVMRELDKKKFKLLVIEAIPEGQDWDAVRDRLQRATANRMGG
jgi:L-threonylcarbamoyladenylate synthase